jgi:hypothetical protein
VFQVACFVVSLYVLWNLGFTLAFFMMHVGGKVVHIVEVSIVISLLCCEPVRAVEPGLHTGVLHDAGGRKLKFKV